MTRLEFAPILENVFILLLIPMNGRRMLLHWNIFVPAHCRRLFGVETSNGEAQRAVDFFSPKNSDGAEGTEWQKSQTDTFSKNLKWMEVQHSRRIFISFFFLNEIFIWNRFRPEIPISDQSINEFSSENEKQIVRSCSFRKCAVCLNFWTRAGQWIWTLSSSSWASVKQSNKKRMNSWHAAIDRMKTVSNWNWRQNEGADLPFSVLFRDVDDDD